MINHSRIAFIFKLLTLFTALLHTSSYAQSTKPSIQLATVYELPNNHSAEHDITHYWISEKLDGIRGYWTGTQLLTREGNPINIPSDFTKNWPNVALDGELWITRNSFEKISSIVRKKTSDINDWQQVKFMIFDLPNNQEKFTQRIKAMENIVNKANSTTLGIIKQNKVLNLKELTQRLDDIVNTQGEGLMLHHQDALYQTGRSKQLMKLKKYDDAEAQVIGHLDGKGKYQNRLGALLVLMPDGTRFKIGSGFSDEQRMTPPPIGCIITYKHFGKTRNGVPRFASFMYIREE